MADHSEDTEDQGHLRVYCRIWGVLSLLELLRGNLTGRTVYEGAQAIALCYIALWPSRPAIFFAFASRILWTLARMPFIFDSETFCLISDIAVLLHMLSATERGLTRTLSWQLGIFYFCAGLWKLNTAFLDHRYSCGSIYVAQLLVAYWPGAPPPAALATIALRLAPLMTVVGECCAGLAMLLADVSRQSGRIGVALALLLHVGIDMTPRPNNIANYSLKVGIRYFWLLPAAITQALDEMARRPLFAASSYVMCGAALLALAISAQKGNSFLQTMEAMGSVWSSGENGAGEVERVDWPIAVHGTLTAIIARALFVVDKSLAAKSKSRSGLRAAPQLRQYIVSGTCIAFLCLWACGAIIFGTHDINSANMYSNLRMHGGSNHLFLPTSLMQRWRYVGHRVTNSPFSGGVVRVEWCNSTWIRGFFPAELTEVLTPGARALLQASGHSGRMFNSEIAVLIGPLAVPPHPGDTFVKYTLPAFEIRRRLKETRERKEAFELEYTQLVGPTGDEQWRRASKGRTVRLIEDGKGGRRCSVVDSEEMRGVGKCTQDDLAIAPFPLRDFFKEPLDAAIGFWQTWNSVPILSGTEVPCFGG